MNNKDKQAFVSQENAIHLRLIFCFWLLWTWQQQCVGYHLSPGFLPSSELSNDMTTSTLAKRLTSKYWKLFICHHSQSAVDVIWFQCQLFQHHRILESLLLKKPCCWFKYPLSHTQLFPASIWSSSMQCTVGK